MNDSYRRDAAGVLRELGVDAAQGLSDSEAAARLARDGRNELAERGARSPWRILWEQFTAVMVLILLAAGAVSAALGKGGETAAILAIVVLFALLGFAQEYRAERAITALRKMAVPRVRVRRSGALREVSARDVVAGDIILLEAGNAVPADARVIESAHLRVQEAALTGESAPVDKVMAALPDADLALGDRRNMVYMGSGVVYGRGAAVVVATGMRSELGRIADLIQSVRHESTPLQQRLSHVGKRLAAAGVAVAALIAVLGVARGEELSEVFLVGVSIAVAIVPEGLPAVVTLTLALGARRMLARRALIRRLPAVETLGSVTVICSDKTGTLTQNRMTVVAVDVAGHRVDLGGEPGSPLPEAVTLALAAGALCNDAAPVAGGEDAAGAAGDPTEVALLVAAARAGLPRARLDAAFPRVAEVPFDSDRKRMTTLHDTSGAAILEAAPALRATPVVAFVKGAVDGLLEVASQAWVDGQAVPMTEDVRRRIEAANDQLAGEGMRVLGLAFRAIDAVPPAAPAGEIERDLVFVGLTGMIDPPRAEVKAAVATCAAAGIRPIMITGDHPLTADAIAGQLGIAPAGRVVSGRELAHMLPAELSRTVENVSVFARVSPEHKLRIVEALQSNGHVVAMTGDGVNDAPALRKANIGVAMGITGTDVSRESSDMVLLDDNFATIVAAVEEGRTIYDNVRRFVKFAVAGNIGKVAVMFFAPFLGMPVALLPLQLLWLNLLTDGLLGLGMGFEPAEANAMRRPPHSPKDGIFSGGMGRHVAWVGALIALLALGVGYAYHAAGNPAWQTMMFTTLAFAQVGQALAVRSMHESLFTIGLLSNRPLLLLALGVAAAQWLVVSLPLTETFFGVTVLSLADLAICAALGGAVCAAIELEKAWLRRGLRRRHGG